MSDFVERETRGWRKMECLTSNKRLSDEGEMMNEPKRSSIPFLPRLHTGVMTNRSHATAAKRYQRSAAAAEGERHSEPWYWRFVDPSSQ